MGAAPALSNGLHLVDRVLDDDAEYEKLFKLRDQVFAGTHPRLKLAKKAPSIAPSKSHPAAPNTNGTLKPSTLLLSASVQNGLSNIPPSQAASDVPPIVQPTPPSKPPSSDFDPVLLTKGPALVREEMLRKRRTIEQSLRDRHAQKWKSSRQRLLEDERLPDFNVTQVLERANDIVKPVRFAEGKIANRAASSSDSFDENDYYSSRGNSWTTDGAEASSRRYPSGKEDEASRAQAMDVDSVDVDEQAKARSRPISVPAVKEKDEAAVQAAARIAELEEKLRLATERNAALIRVGTPPHEKGLIEEPEYSPPDVQQPPPQGQQPQNHVSNSQTDHAQTKEAAPRRSSRPLPPQSREYAAAARNEPASSPVQSDMRIVRNHITSPLAPQPARVSPLAVAKAPPVSQLRDLQQDERRGPRVAGIEKPAGGRTSPNQPMQPLNPRKRRRGKGSGEIARNVVPRREANSPEVRIKEEPVSPQLRPTALEAWRPPRTEEVRRPVYVDTVSPQRRASDNATLPSRRSERLAQQSFMGDPGRPFTPTERRNVQRNGQLIEINDEPDLRRVVGVKQIYLPPAGPEQPRPYRPSIQPQAASHNYPDHPPSPVPRNPQRASSRVGSIVMAPPQPRIVVDQYGNRFVEAPVPQERQMSVVPVARPGDNEHFYEQTRRPTMFQQPSYQNGFDDRHYVQRVPSPTSPRYVQRATSPTSPRYVQRAPSPGSPRYARPANDLNKEGYFEEHYVPQGDKIRLISHTDNHSDGRFEDFARPRDPVTRLHSVRPVGQYEVPRVQSVRPGQDRVVSMRPVVAPYEAPRVLSMQPEQDRMVSMRPMTSQYEIPREHLTRVQSARPEPERIISLTGRREVIPRQVSVRPEDMYARPPGPIVEERARYSYVPEPQDRRYAEDDVFNDRVAYQAPGSGSRRTMQ